MDDDLLRTFERKAEILRAMASAARLAIVSRLSGGDCSVGELTGVVGLDISTVSRHLLVLRNAGIVASRRLGNMMMYSLRTPCVLEMLDCVQGVQEHGVKDSASCCSSCD